LYCSRHTEICTTRLKKATSGPTLGLVQHTRLRTQPSTCARYNVLRLVAIHVLRILASTLRLFLKMILNSSTESPGSAATYPLLLIDTAAQVHTQGVNKLQLAVGTPGSGQEVNVPWRKARCWQHITNVSGWPDARLLQCSNFSDSHAYVIQHSQARHIVAAQQTLVQHAGIGRGRCINPWGFHSCASDPSIFREFFKQCDKSAEINMQGCRGLTLASLSQPWSLYHNNSEAYRMQSKDGTDVYGAVKLLRASLRERALQDHLMRVPNMQGKEQGNLHDIVFPIKLNPNKKAAGIRIGPRRAGRVKAV